MNIKRPENTDLIPLIIYCSILAMVVFMRCLILHEFSFIYSDSDQAIMWGGAKDFSNGIFREPRFYGLSYNTMLEALFAVPFMKLSVLPFIALPIVTSIMALLPYLLISIICFKKNLQTEACFIMSIPLLLPIEYDIITTLSRGFVTGIFVVGFGCISIFYPDKKMSYFLMGFLCVLSFSISPNSALISIPCLLILWFGNINNKKFYLYSCIGILIGLCIHFSVAYFYYLHPSYAHDMVLAFKFYWLNRYIGTWDHHFNDVSPIFWKSGGWFIPGVFLLMITYFVIKRKGKEIIFLSSGLLLILFSFGLNKVYDGIDSIFFSYSRMYLAIPIMLALALSLFRFNKFLLLPLLLMSYLFFCVKIYNLNESIEKIMDSNHFNVITTGKNKDVFKECKKLKQFSEKYHLDLIVVKDHYWSDYIVSGCNACIDNFPNTLAPSGERRVWRMEEDEQRVYKNILIIDISKSYEDPKLFPNVNLSTVPNENVFFLVSDNHLPTMDLLRYLKINIMAY